MKHTLSLTLIVLTLGIQPAHALTKLQECQQLKDKMEQVKDDRRKGGSSQYMNRLNKERQRLNKAYAQLQCYRIRTELK